MQVLPYETYVRQEPWRFLEEGSKFFMGSGDVNATLHDLVRRLDEAHIPYALLGALALGRHGLPRFTVDVNVLLTKAGLEEFRSAFEGLGYVPAFPGARKKFRATETGVGIDFITTGEYPGDGRSKSIAFPDPAECSVEMQGIRVVKLETFIELKLCSGLTVPDRLKDLADIQELIRHAKLPASLADRLDESVREEYLKLWRQVQTPDFHNEQPAGS